MPYKFDSQTKEAKNIMIKAKNKVILHLNVLLSQTMSTETFNKFLLV